MKKMSKRKKIIIVISTLLLIIATASVGTYYYIKSKIYVEPEKVVEVPKEDKEEIKYQEQNGIINILLVGIDGRTLDEKSRSDSIIIATIDTNLKKVKLSSIMRDTLIKIPGYGEQKINAAYSIGGPELLIKTIKENFGVTLDKYVVVNFWGFQDIVDAMGGLDIDVKDYEINEINKYIGEVDTVKSPPLTKSGLQHLDGQQALSYARIRKVGNGDYERVARQKSVVTLLAQKGKEISPIKYPSVANALLKCVKTNIDPMTIFNYAYTFYKFDNPVFEQLQIPATELSQGGEYMDKGRVFLIDAKQNGKVLQDFIFNDKKWESKDYNLASFRSIISQYMAKAEAFNPADKPALDENGDVINPSTKTPTKTEGDGGTVPTNGTGGATTPGNTPANGGTTGGATTPGGTPSNGGTTPGGSNPPTNDTGNNQKPPTTK
ncbi:LCP family protein [Clostridium sp. 'White wine YQ']|uniref:LCP family protein n=1 Tax=Clostridium sp. 'White wine YQ' TaxID=3027474 RepID=UPI0023656508|nr:LCP family protein [Clostridium sp. 'White wine YQ']MDD7793238.1 LCP family protein [Clostridium sp. 'White wine YQ']